MNKKINPVFAFGIIVILAIIVVVLAWLAIQSIDNAETGQKIQPKINKNTEHLVGGPCSYDKILGTCKINSVSPDKTVKFNFTPANPVQNNFSETLKREQVEALNYLVSDSNMNIKAGDKIDCEASLITKGTCTPIIFKFTQNNDISNWKTFKNDKYGFEFKYPNEWRVGESDNRPENDTLLDDVSLYDPKCNDEDRGKLILLIIRVWKNTSPEELISGIQKLYFGQCLTKKSELTGINSTRLACYIGKTETMIIETETFNHKGNSFEIVKSLNSNPFNQKRCADQIDLLPKVISTFNVFND